MGGGIGGGICGKLKEGLLEFHPFAGPGGMPLTPAFCAKEADVSATASNTLPLMRLPTKSDLSFAGAIKVTTSRLALRCVYHARQAIASRKQCQRQ